MFPSMRTMTKLAVRTAVAFAASSTPSAVDAASSNNTPAPPTIKCLLCDIDGSLVHYPEVLSKHGAMRIEADSGATLSYLPHHLAGTDAAATPTELIALPPSTTGTRGLISRRA